MHDAGIDHDFAAIGAQQRQRTGFALALQHLAHHAHGLGVDAGRMHGEDGLAEQVCIVAKPRSDCRIDVLDTPVDVEHEDKIGDRLKEPIQILPLQAGILARLQAFQRLTELAGDAFEKMHHVFRHAAYMPTGQIQAGIGASVDKYRHDHQRGDALTPNVRQAYQFMMGADGTRLDAAANVLADVQQAGACTACSNIACFGQKIRADAATFDQAVAAIREGLIETSAIEQGKPEYGIQNSGHQRVVIRAVEQNMVEILLQPEQLFLQFALADIRLGSLAEQGLALFITVTDLTA